MTSVSFLITLYNKSAFLPFVLAGLQAQNGPFTREFIFVDDGSTDNTVVELRRLTADWHDPVIILQQANAGPAVAFNNGLAKATGDLLKPVDGDDVLTPWATAALYEAMQRHGAQVAFGLNHQDGYSPAGTVTPEALLAGLVDNGAASEARPDAFMRSLRRSNSNPTCWLAETDLVRRAGGCDPAVFIQDYSIELRLMYLARAAAYTPRPIFIAPAVAAGRLSDNEAQILHDINMAMAGFLEAYPDLPRRYRRLAFRRCFGRAWAWARRHNGQRALSREHLRYMRALLPWHGLTPDQLRESTAVFRVNRAVRIPKPKPSAE